MRKKTEDVERIAEMADDGKDISGRFTNRFAVVKPAISTAREAPVAGSDGRRCTIAELLKEMEPGAPRSEEDQAWLDMPPVGREILPEEDEVWLRSFGEKKAESAGAAGGDTEEGACG